MTIKKSIIQLMLIMLIAVGLTISVGCGKKSEKGAEVTKGEEKAAVSEKGEDAYIELWAQTAYISKKYAGDPAKASKEIQKFYANSGINTEEYQKWMTDWQKKVQANPTKYSKEWQDIMAKYQKRLKELEK